MRSLRRLFCGGLALLALGALGSSGCGRDGGGEHAQVDAGAAPSELVVFAAASLRDVMAELAPQYEAASGQALVFNFAGSNVLALQIEASPVADVFLSADEKWVDELERAELLVPGSRRTFLSNHLVVVAHRDSDWQLPALAGLAELPFRYLSLADPAAVPAGRYARQTLEATATPEGNLWQQLEARVAPALDVRAALALVEAEPDVVGIVYGTDAKASDRVRVLLAVPEVTPPIRYAAAAVGERPDPASALRFLDFLTSPAAVEVCRAHGFVAPP